MPIESWNVTMTNYPSEMAMTNTMTGGLFVWLVIMIVAAAILIYTLTSFERYTKFWGKIAWIFSSLKYTVFGAGITAVLYGIYIVCDMLASFGSGINPIHLGLGIFGYVVLTAIGWCAEKVINRSRQYREQQKSAIEPSVVIR